MAAKPVPTAAPSTYGLKQYYPMSSQTNPMASNYIAPSSSNTGQLNAYGAPLSKTNAYSTNERVVKTDPLIGTFAPTAGPAPQPQPQPQAEDPNQAIWNQIDNEEHLLLD